MLDSERFTVLSMLISAKGSDVNARDVDGETPLSLACKRKAWKAAKVLLTRGADPASHGVYPSCLARTIEGDGGDEITREILKTNPNCAQEPAALIAGIRAGHMDVLKAAMEKGGTCHVREGSGFQMPGVLVTCWSAPLWWSCYFGQLQFVKDLVGAGSASSVHSADAQGLTLLHWCAIWGLPIHTDIATELVRQGANVNAKDKNGETPVHWAAKYGRADMMNMLTSNNGDVEAPDNNGQSANDAATKSGAAAAADAPKEFADNEALMAHYAGAGSPFFDTDFAPGVGSLAANPAKIPASFREIQWLRAADVNVTPTSIGMAATPWFTAASEDASPDNFVGDASGASGAYVVKCIGTDGEIREVVVDDLIPCIAGAPAFSGRTVKALIVEKAYAKCFGSYEALLGGWAPQEAPEHAVGQEVQISKYANSMLQSIMCSPMGRKLKDANALDMSQVSEHFASQPLPKFSEPVMRDDTGPGGSIMSVGSRATGCNAAYTVIVQSDAVLCVTVTKNDDAALLTGSVDVYSEMGSSWVFVGSKACSGADYTELEVPVPAAGSPYVVLPSFGPDAGYNVQMGATEEVSIRPMMRV